MPSKIVKYIKEPWRIPLYLQERGLGRLIPDSIYLRSAFRNAMGYPLDLKNPKTFNEKLQWLKLNDRKPIYAKMVDKYEAKKFAASIIGEQYIIPTLGVWNSVEDIDFQSLPDQFVIKCTHDSGGLIICKDKSKLDIEAAKKKLKSCMDHNYYLNGREWPYKNVKPRIIAEEYLTDESGIELKDYKVFTFNETPKVIQVDFNRFIHHIKNLYTTDWKLIEAQMNYPNDPTHNIKRPEKLDDMLELAKKLSKNTSFLRVDFYSIEDKIYFGEMTFYPASGFAPFTPEEFGIELGSYIKLPEGGYLINGESWLLLICFKKMPGITDYKVWCFNGKPYMTLVCQDRYEESGLKEDFYGNDWKRLDLERPSHTNSRVAISQPRNFALMKDLSSKLSDGTRFSRIDFYEVNNKLLFGEITFYPASGFEGFSPAEWDLKLGKMIQLS